MVSLREDSCDLTMSIHCVRVILKNSEVCAVILAGRIVVGLVSKKPNKGVKTTPISALVGGLVSG